MRLTITGWSRFPDCRKVNFFMDMENVLKKYNLGGWFDE